MVTTTLVDESVASPVATGRIYRNRQTRKRLVKTKGGEAGSKSERCTSNGVTERLWMRQ
jgi:hypothetical protein